jgi:hypothetical protein
VVAVAVARMPAILRQRREIALTAAARNMAFSKQRTNAEGGDDESPDLAA